jgi:glycosyltransferase involved in cell wall biosynthesis
MKASVIMSTYNAIDWLEKVIWGFSAQTITDFELVIADDGSTPETKHKIDALRSELNLSIIHVWQEDHGFQKTKILNKAILASTSDYLIFTDGDCIPRADFVETHLRFRQAGYFLSGGYFKLPMATSLAITKTDVLQQHCFQLPWLKAHGLSFTSKSLKLLVKGFWANALNALTPTTPSWNGHNASGWKADLLAVNGFDEEMKYGGEDRELGERLFHYGLLSKQIRYSAICVHLDHARGYVSDEVWKKNNAIRAYTKANKVIETPNGIRSN